MDLTETLVEVDLGHVTYWNRPGNDPVVVLRRPGTIIRLVTEQVYELAKLGLVELDRAVPDAAKILVVVNARGRQALASSQRVHSVPRSRRAS